MKRVFAITTFLSIFIALFSCTDTASVHKNVSGKAGEIAIVIPKEKWEGEVGHVMRKALQQPQIGLPQEEPLFDLIHIPPSAFKDLFKAHRNIINVLISPTLDSSKVEFRKDIWAWPQSVVNIHAKTPNEFISLFEENSNKIIGYILRAERDRLQINYGNFLETSLRNKIQDKFDIKVNIPRGFLVANESDDFLWLRYDTKDITQGIIIYNFPYVSDSTFTVDYLVNKRDSLLKIYVEGPPSAGNTRTFMSTEHQLPPELSFFEFNKNYSAEMRGLWKIDKAFMGGPFVNLAILDEARGRVIVLEGFVYAPRFDKRNYLRQVEAIIYSVNMPAPDEKDKES